MIPAEVYADMIARARTITDPGDPIDPDPDRNGWIDTAPLAEVPTIAEAVERIEADVNRCLCLQGNRRRHKATQTPSIVIVDYLDLRALLDGIRRHVTGTQEITAA